jgi:tol-pal system protein YbgF
LAFLYKKRWRTKSLFAAALMLGVFSPALVSAGSSPDVGTRIDQLEFQAQGLSQSLQALSGAFDGRGLTPPANIGQQSPLEAPIMVAQARDVAAMNLRLSQIEEQMRVLVGQMEGLQFQMTQIQALIERQTEDNEFRFQQLEGGASGKTNAVTRPGGVTPSGGLPQNNDLSAPVDLNAPIELGGGTITGGAVAGGTIAGSAVAGGTPAGGALGGGTLAGGDPFFEENENLDANGAGVVFGTNPGLFDNSTASLSQDGQTLGVQTLGNQPLDLNYDPGSLVTNSDADAQYRAGYEAVTQGDYVFAETQFRQFVALFPNHPQAPDATNWLGEALLQRQQYDEAAQVLFDGFQLYENTTRAPDLLLKLGIALVGAGQRDTACRTFGEVLRRYPDMAGGFINRVSEEMNKAQC